MRLKLGVEAENIRLPAIDGSMFEIESVKGKPFMLSFFRFASCPFCNLRVNELVRRFDEFGNDFTIIAVFDSPLDNLIRHAEGHKAPFPIVADEDNKYYRAYGIEHSVLGMLKGMFLRMPTLLKGMFKGYIPTTIKGSMTTMPADFLIDREGIIQVAYYGKDEGDHLPFDVVKEFSLK
jgi:thioredoxin-dependent peroxiredoxin